MPPPLLRAIWAYRGFIFGSVKREFASRYRNSMLGASWLVLQPLAQILVFTLIFAEVMRARLPSASGQYAYSIFLCAGSLTWGLFAEIVGRSQTVFLDNANLLKKLSFPRICLPIILLLNACLGFIIIFSLFACFLLLSGQFPGGVFIAMIPVLAVQIVFAVGLGMVLAVLNVFFRDIGQLFGILINFWFWLTPIVYPISSLPNWAADYIKWNPMTPLVVAYQNILLNGIAPTWTTLFPTLAGGVILCLLGLRLYKLRIDEMVDEL